MGRFIGIKEVCALVGLSKTQITARDNDGKPRTGMEDFPDPIYSGYRRLYDEDEVLDWQQRKRDNRKTTTPPKRERKPKSPYTEEMTDPS